MVSKLALLFRSEPVSGELPGSATGAGQVGEHKMPIVVISNARGNERFPGLIYARILALQIDYHHLDLWGISEIA